MSLRKLVFIGDAHIPYHDKKAFGHMLRCVKAFEPDDVVIMGDWADAYCVSSHDKDPTRKGSLEWEIGEARKCLDMLSLVCKRGAKKYFIEGNHETRIARYIAKHCPELVDLVKVPDLLQLKEKGYSYTPYKQSLKLGKLHLTHDLGSAGPTAHMKAAAVYGSNVVIGHVHSAGISYTGSINGERHVGMSVGWLGDLKSIDYMHVDVSRKNWQHGVGYGYMESNGNVHLHFAPFIQGSCIIEGKVIR